MSHWILTEDRLQTFVTLLDQNKCTLKYAKAYFEGYGVKIKGQTKEQFIRNLRKVVDNSLKEIEEEKQFAYAEKQMQTGGY